MTPGGGGGTCWQSSRSRMKMPRAVGDVSVGPAVEARNVPWPRIPARFESGGKLHHLELILRRRQAVHLGELRRQEAVIGRQRFHEVAIVPDQMMQQRPRLFGHRQRQLGRERLIPVRLHGIDDAIEAQPLFEELIERVASLRRVLEHPPRGALATGGRAQLTLAQPPRTARRPASCSRAGTTAGSPRRSPCTVRRGRLRRGTGNSATAASLRRRRARRRGSGG